MVSAADQHPANARPECGVTWLAWGPQAQGLLIYRHMLAEEVIPQGALLLFSDLVGFESVLPAGDAGAGPRVPGVA